LTPLGVAVAIVAAVSLFGFGFGKLDLVLLVLGYGGVGLLAISTLIVVFTAAGVAWRIRGTKPPPATARLETGRPHPTGFALSALRWLPLVKVRWAWVAPPSAEVRPALENGLLAEWVTIRERGIFSSARRRVFVEDAFGLARVVVRHRQYRTLEVLPHVGGLRRLPVLTSLTGGDEIPHPMGIDDGDRTETRRYIAGDPARFIHWKAFSRTRKLMVRMPERSLSRARRTVAYLVAGLRDEAPAAAARAAIEEEALGTDWHFGADGSPEPTTDAAEAMHKVMTSARFSGPSGSGLRRFLAEVDRAGPAALVVFAPAWVGPWIAEVGALGRHRAGRVRVVVAIDAVGREAPKSKWRRWLLSPVADAGVTRTELESVGRMLGKLRCEVVVVDRISGRVLGDATRVSTWTQRAA